jgi:hypothetical protein
MNMGRSPVHSSRRFRNLGLTAALFVVSCMIAAAIGELLVRLLAPQPILPRYVESAPYGIRTNIPSMTYWHTSPDYRINFRINSQGMRSDREYAVPKPPGVFRIVGLGDSFTMGYEVDLEDTYLYQLENILRERGVSNVEVLNLAVSGFGSAEELLKLEHEGLEYEPDLVIVGYFVNDVENNLTSELFALRGDTLVPTGNAYLPAMGIRRTLEAIGPYAFVADNSHLFNLFRNYLSYYIQQAMYKNKGEESASLRTPSGAAYEMLLTARLLDSLSLLCRGKDIPLMLFNIPNLDRQSGVIYSNIPLDLMHERHNVTFVDARPIVQPALGKREIHWKWQGHWFPWVHHEAGRLLADSVQALLTRRSVLHNSQ